MIIHYLVGGGGARLLSFDIPFCGGPPRLGGGGGAVRGIVAVGAPPLGGFGLGDRGDEGFFFKADKLLPDPPDEVKPRGSRVGGGGGGPPLPAKRFDTDDVTLVFDIFRPTDGGGAGGFALVGGGGGGPVREGPPDDDELRLLPLNEFDPLEGGGGGPFRCVGGGPARVGGGGG